MLTDKDIKALKGQSEFQFKIIQALFIFGIVLLFFGCYNNVSLAISYAGKVGLSFQDILAIWSDEVQLNRAYSGYEVESLNRINSALLSFGSALIISIQAYGIAVTRSRNKRILATIESQ